MLALRARWVFPIDSPPIHNGVVAIDHDRIVAVGPATSRTLNDFLPAACDLGDVAILPGLVNPHTHLEFSDLTHPLGAPGVTFPDWIRLVVQNRRDKSQLPEIDPIAIGITESVQHGVTAIGEIASSPWQRDSSPLEITEFCEIICFRKDGDHERYQAAINAVSELNSARQSSITWSDAFRPGISPHAPYSVRPELIMRCAQLSMQQHIPIALHLAESKEELQLLRDRSGPLVDLMTQFNQWDPELLPPGSKPLRYLQMLAEADRALVIHGNYLDDAEIEFLAQRARWMSVVYCPRTHAYFQHDPYPLTKMLAAGVNVAIGTDSRASNPDLSVLAEARFAAAQHPAMPPATFLRMITSSAAQALGRDQEIGALAPDKFADLAILKLSSIDATDPYELLLDPASTVAATIFRGGVVWGEKIQSPS